MPAPHGPPPPSAPTAMRLRWSLRDLSAADDHRLTVTFSATIQPIAEPAEQQLFAETFGTSGSVAPSAVVAHFEAALSTAAAAHARTLTAAAAVSPDAAGAWIAALRTAGDAVAFACGVELVAPVSVDLASPTLQQQQLEQMRHLAAERRSASRLERLAQGAELLRRWEQLRAAAPSLSPGQVLQQLDPSDQGPMLQTLLLASASADAGGAANTHADLWAVAGPMLIRIEQATLAASEPGRPEPRLVALPTSLGPLRSVSAEGDRLLIGAQRGVLLVDRADLTNVQAYLDPELASEHGFSRVVLVGERIWAIHRDGGLVAWEMGHLDRPARTLRPAALGGQPPRQLLALDEHRLLLAAGNRLLHVESDRSPEVVGQASDTIAGLLTCDQQLFVAAEDGSIVQRDAGTLAAVGRMQPAGRIAAAAALPWLGSVRLLLANCDGPIVSVGLEDPLMMQYGGAGGSVRALAAMAGRVAAMTADRQRVVVWNAWDGRSPAAQLQLGMLARHRIADLAFG